MITFERVEDIKAMKSIDSRKKGKKKYFARDKKREANIKVKIVTRYLNCEGISKYRETCWVKAAKVSRLRKIIERKPKSVLSPQNKLLLKVI